MKARRRLFCLAFFVIALVTMVAAYANAREPGAERSEPDIPAADAAAVPPADAAAVEAELARTGLMGEMEKALGKAFGGFWFDRPTAQLHVGVTSPESRQIAEEVAAKAELAANVTETPVRSSWAELLAAQKEWGIRLADLFDWAEVSTAVRAQHNAVEVRLGSAVPPSRRADLQRTAEASPVGVSIIAAQVPRIRIERQAKTCRAFEEHKAYCDPTITAGVRIEAQGGEFCTAGPVVLPDAHVTTDSYLLTAGHCIENGGGAGVKWYAYPKNAKEKAHREEIGKAVEFLYDTSADVGVIKIENAFWMTAGLTPIDPAVALWSGAESEPEAVTGEQFPTEGMETCVSGQTSGQVCGEIVKYPVHAVESEGLAEVSATTKNGDSGAPWYSKAAPSIMEGTHVGENTETKTAVFEPLKTSFEELKLKLKLLTDKNKKRHVC